jgi:hypothetical protein
VAKWLVIDGLSSCLLQGRRVLWVKLRIRKVYARLSRDLERETMPNLSLRSHELLLHLLPAVIGIVLLCLPLGYVRLGLHVEMVGAAAEKTARAWKVVVDALRSKSKESFLTLEIGRRWIGKRWISKRWCEGERS